MIARTTLSASETEAFGGLLAGLLQPGDIVLIRGELGAGRFGLREGGHRNDTKSKRAARTTGAYEKAHIAYGIPFLLVANSNSNERPAYHLSGPPSFGHRGGEGATRDPAVGAMGTPNQTGVTTQT